MLPLACASNVVSHAAVDDLSMIGPRMASCLRWKISGSILEPEEGWIMVSQLAQKPWRGGLGWLLSRIACQRRRISNRRAHIKDQ